MSKAQEGRFLGWNLSYPVLDSAVVVMFMIQKTRDSAFVKGAAQEPANPGSR